MSSQSPCKVNNLNAQHILFCASIKFFAHMYFYLLVLSETNSEKHNQFKVNRILINLITIFRLIC